ncbi:glycosyltransferase family 2 protein [Candidatus Gottesmanbacteria bacterium]|nr:glycosyltransferase family 2 protein [Candidatus Gottesmanbacteria bacterium]
MLSSLTITIPAHNEELTLGTAIKEALEVGKIVAKTFELLLIDDGSRDSTGHIMDQYAKRHGEINILHHNINQGFTGAIQSCYENASKHWVFLAPADGQIHISDLSLFIEKSKGADVIIGYRKTRPESIVRKINSQLFHTLYRTLFGITLKEISTAILWKKEILDHIAITSHPRSAMIQAEALYKAKLLGAKFSEVAVPYYARKAGRAHGTDPLMILQTLKEMLRLWWEMKIRV